MADEKKEEKKPEGSPLSGQGASVTAEIISLFIFLMLISALFNSLSSRINLNKFLSGDFSGLSPKGILLAHTVPISSLENPIGTRVVSLNKTDVYDSPGGKKIGSQKVGARGKILQGPVEINGERYWYVDYDSGVDGWVKESDIAALVSEPNRVERFLIWLFSLVGLIKLVIILFCILVFIYILYLNMKISPILENERKRLYPTTVQTVDMVNPKWEKIQAHVESLNESDWRISIIEADILLGELLEQLSLPGDTIGEKLKAVEKSDFRTLDDAWEAHKARNRISHDGQEYMINQREAKGIIAQYQKVFEEFEII